MFYVQRTSIDLGVTPAGHYGHAVYIAARYVDGLGTIHPIVYKENKHGNPIFSSFEVIFSALASVFMNKKLTPRIFLVKDPIDHIIGLACEHIRTHILEREGMLPCIFYTIPDYKPIYVTKLEDVPYYFLDQCPRGFFNTLRDGEKQGILSIDYASLAEIFACSYTLEEDDLHKGNFGFYVGACDAKPRVSFFKIDHDLMFSDSIMSHYSPRAVHWGANEHAFAITRRDLKFFPILRDSGNYYWPTRKHKWIGFGRKAYTNKVEVQGFAALATDERFVQAKWHAFYRHILLPEALIQETLCRHLDPNHPKERAEIRLMMQAVVSRQSHLRGVLFSLPEFRTFVMHAEHHTLLEAILGESQDPAIREQVSNDLLRYQELCQKQVFVEEDTPLHVAIRLGDYRYYDTWNAFGHFLHQKNKEGKTPLDVAVQHAAPSLDIRHDMPCIMKHLLQQGARATLDFNIYTRNESWHINNYLFRTGYPSKASQSQNIEALIMVLRDVSEDYRYCLKMQKEITVLCVQSFIRSHLHHPELKSMLLLFQSALNDKDDTLSPPLNFIRQLRSRLWFVRFMRGLLGSTSTQIALNKIIDETIKKSTIQDRPCRFFSNKEAAASLFHEPSMTHNHGLPS